MAHDFNSAGDRVETTFTAHASQRTYALWAYRDSDGHSTSVARLMDKRDAGAEVELWYIPGSTMAYQRSFSGGAGRWDMTKPATGGWHHFACVYDSSSTANDPILYLDGSDATGVQVNTPSGTASTNSDQYVIGNRGDGSRTWDGRLCEFAIWDRLLSADEVAALAEGYSPLFFPEGLVEYVPLVRDAQSYLNGAPTATGTSVIEHPRIVYPNPQSLIAPVSGQVSFTGTIAASLPSLTASATGTQEQTGTITATLPSLTASATGTQEMTGTAAATLPSLTASATGTVAQFHGTAAVTLPSLVASATGTQEQTGTAAVTLPSLTLSATGAQEMTGTAAVTLPSLTMSATGAAGAFVGALEATLPSLSLAATGAVTNTYTGTAVLALPSLGMQASGIALSGYVYQSPTAPDSLSYGPQSGASSLSYGPQGAPDDYDYEPDGVQP